MLCVLNQHWKCNKDLILKLLISLIFIDCKERSTTFILSTLVTILDYGLDKLMLFKVDSVSQATCQGSWTLRLLLSISIVMMMQVMINEWQMTIMTMTMTKDPKDPQPHRCVDGALRHDSFEGLVVRFLSALELSQVL